MVLLDAVVLAGTQESVDVKVMVGVGWGRVLEVVLQVQPATAVAVGLGDAAASGLAEVPARMEQQVNVMQIDAKGAKLLLSAGLVRC